jgi:S-formylglutathione hydrolase FrmB
MSACRSTISALLLLFAAPAVAGEVATGLRAPSAALGREIEYSLYSPGGPTRGLPVVYLLHGRAGDPDEWLRMGKVRETADRLVAEGRIPRLLVVLPKAGNSWYADSPPGGPGAFETALVRDLPAHVERTTGASGRREGRAVLGNSMGGQGALRFAFGHPDRYVAAASLSGAFWTRVTPRMDVDADMQARLARVFEGAFGTPFDPARFVAANPLTLAARAAAHRPAIFLTVGRGDRFGLADEQDRVEAELRRLGHAVEAAKTDGDHEWGVWEAALPEALLFLARYLRAE